MYDPFIIEQIQKKACYFDEDTVYDYLLQKIDGAAIVLLGEASHGTQEFYDIRSEITKRLIVEKGFNAIAVEGDWPDAYQVNKYIHGQEFTNGQQAVSVFDRFPSWMWQNTSIVKLAEWLKKYNVSSNVQVSFYGLDLYCLYRSIDVIITYLQKVDPVLAREAMHRYACLEQFRHDPQEYGYYVAAKLSPSCEQEVIAELKKIEELELQLLRDKISSPEQAFYLIQNARVVKNSENYYRSLFVDEVNNWNLRDSHMMETLEEILMHYQKNGVANPKIVVWAHNSHIGNAAATQMSSHGEFNLGQLVQEKYQKKVYSVGFTTYNGTVSAASNWHMPVERKVIRNALGGSYEDLFHHTGISKFLLTLEDKNIVPHELLERAIGVVYSPKTERQSHYFYASLAHQFNAVIHYDTTTAVEPIQKNELWLEGEVPETYPSGL